MRTFTKMSRHGARGLGVTALVGALALAGCSSGSSDGTSQGASNASSVKIDLPAMDPVTTFEGPTDVVQAPKGKHIMILLCGKAGEGCVVQAAGAKAAAEALGWTADVVDGKLDPAQWNSLVSQAVDQKVDGIIDTSIDPALMGDAMAKVAKAKIPFTVTMSAEQPTEPEGTASYVSPDPPRGGKIIADWIQADSGDKASVLILDSPEYPDSILRNDTIADQLKKDCSGCSVSRVKFSAQTMGTSLAPLVASQLQQHPDINYVWAPYDAGSAFVAQGIQQAGKTKGVKLVTHDGSPAAFARIGDGTQAADLATPRQYAGWLAVDGLVRSFAGAPVKKNWDVPVRLFTTDNIKPDLASLTKDSWETEMDYQAEFKRLWGLS